MRSATFLFKFCVVIAFSISTANAETFVPISTGGITIIIPINDPPVATSDQFTLEEQWTPSTVIFDVLANDQDEDLSTVQVELVSGVANSQNALSLVEQHFEFVPQQGGYVGQDGFSYRLIDSQGLVSNTVTVAIDIVEGNDPPTTQTDRADLYEDNEHCNATATASSQTCQITLDVLANDIDPEGGPLTLDRVQAKYAGREINGVWYDAQTLKGLIKIVANGVEYHPSPALFNAADGTQFDSFDYYVRDDNGAEAKGSIVIVLKKLAVDPYVVRFEWEPAIQKVGQPMRFHWDVRNVQNCTATTAGQGQPSVRDPSGSTGEFILYAPFTKVTQWYCTDLKGNRYPATGYLEAIRTVELLDAPTSLYRTN